VDKPVESEREPETEDAKIRLQWWSWEERRAKQQNNEKAKEKNGKRRNIKIHTTQKAVNFHSPARIDKHNLVVLNNHIQLPPPCKRHTDLCELRLGVRIRVEGRGGDDLNGGELYRI
jgi:hypothetical protein